MGRSRRRRPLILGEGEDPILSASQPGDGAATIRGPGRSDRPFEGGTMSDYPDAGHDYQLTIGRLLQRPLRWSPEQTIVYRDSFQYTYADMGRRVRKLASMLASLGVKQGDAVAFMDWDSHRYLEGYFAVPMMGAVLHTINVRLSRRADPLHHQPRRGPGPRRPPRLPAHRRADPRSTSRRSARSSSSPTGRSRRRAAPGSTGITSACSRRRPTGSTSPTSTSGRSPPPSTPPAPPASPRASSSRTGRSCCTP